MIPNIRQLVAAAGLELDPSIDELRPQQHEGLTWLLDRPEPYLFLNAPTGSGKTLLLGLYGIMAKMKWTYGVHTIRLQQQVAETFRGLPVVTGRSNHPCLIGEETYPGEKDVHADRGVCVVGMDCVYGVQSSDPCPYYAQLRRARTAPYRVANYAVYLALSHGRSRLDTDILLADEAHNLERIVADEAGMRLARWTYRKFGLHVPQGNDLEAWAEWAQGARRELEDQQATDSDGRPELGLPTVRQQLEAISRFTEGDQGNWLVKHTDKAVEFQPIWGREFVMERLFGHREVPDAVDLEALAAQKRSGVKKVVMASATMMGAEFIADMLGLPAGSWAYLDLPSVFPASNRPINFAPVGRKWNRAVMATPEGRAPMQEAVDRIIQFYLVNGRTSGLIHAVSNRYRENLLTESKWQGIMVSSPDEHRRRVSTNRPSVLVAANLTEGWDGIDDLCRFTIMPKVPYPDLSDQRTAIRREEDPRTYDWQTLVSVVQGAGRGVRHDRDYADTWILDPNWRLLMLKRKEWLPDSFLSAYHPNVRLP